MKDKTLLLLIDFHGHPVLGDDYTNELRYSTLHGLLQDEKDMIVISNHQQGYPRDRCPNKIEELYRMYTIEGIHKWTRIDADRKPEWSIREIENLFANRLHNISNVILGGTNLAGCVLRSKPYSAIHWAKRGYHTQIFLPLCVEYQLPGVNQADRHSHATSVMYNVIREEKLFDKIDLVRNSKQLKIV